MTSTLQLSITPYKPSTIPPEEQILAAGREIIDSSTSWKQGKSYNTGTVKTYSRPKGPSDGAQWHCRVSEHAAGDATFDEFWSKLGKDKAENEKQYIHDIHKVTLVKRISPTQSIWTLHYTFPPPVSPRVFTVLQVTHLDDAGPRKTGYIVSLPIDLTSSPEDSELAKLEEKGVKARYVSVERLQELENGLVEWRMATSSTPAGNIPQFIAERSMASKISEDVPHFLKWFHSVRDKPTTTIGETALETDPTSTASAAAAEPANAT